MEQGYSDQYETASVIIVPGENPLIDELVMFAHNVGAVRHNEEDGIDLVIDDQSGHLDRQVGPELYDENMLIDLQVCGQNTFYALVS